jgi:hypothetical protein
MPLLAKIIYNHIQKNYAQLQFSSQLFGFDECWLLKSISATSLMQNTDEKDPHSNPPPSHVKVLKTFVVDVLLNV